MALPLFFHARQPDFSGTWIATTAAPQGFPAAPSPVFGARFAIALDGGSLTLTRMSRDGSFPVTMPLGGEPVQVRTPGRTCEGDGARIEKVAMEGGALAYTLVGTVAAGAAEPRIINAKYTIRAEGPDTISVQGTMVRQGETQAAGTVYKRSTESMPSPAPPSPLPVKGVNATIAQVAWIGTTWALTSVTADSATFENPSHDYPRLVRYARLPDGSLQTTISAGGDVRAQTVTLRKQ